MALSAQIEKSNFLSKLMCPHCSGSVRRGPNDSILCNGCGKKFSFENDIANFLQSTDPSTKLEDIDYEQAHQIKEKTIEKVAEEWIQVFKNSDLNINNKEVLEIGSGTGVLTTGILRKTNIKLFFATDISKKFLSITNKRAQNDDRLFCLACNCNRMTIAPEQFDVIIGRSILHHLLDYPDVLGQCARILRPGGKAYFFEPFIDGKLVIAFFASLIIKIAQASDNNPFDDQEIHRLKHKVRYITKEIWYPQNRDSLAKIEDKFIFHKDQLAAVGLAKGFSSVNLIPGIDKVDQTYWSHFMHTMALLKIDASKLAQFKFIGDSFGETIGAIKGEDIQKPMNYICFNK